VKDFTHDPVLYHLFKKIKEFAAIRCRFADIFAIFETIMG